MTSTKVIEKLPRELCDKADYPAFSFFFRIHSGSEKQLHDSGHIRNRVHEVIKAANLPSTRFNTTISQADELIDQLAFESGALSVGLFLSAKESYLTQYFVNIPERDYLGSHFSGYESIYAQKESAPYLLFLLEPDCLNIFLGRGEHLEKAAECDEIRHLLSVYKRRSARHADKDGRFNKGQLHDPAWQKELLTAVANVCSKQQLPAFFSGLSIVSVNEAELCSHGIDVLSSSDDVFLHTGGEALKIRAQEFLGLYRTAKTKRLVEKCREAKGLQKLASGPDEVLDCAKEGRGEILVLPAPAWESSGTLELGPLHETIREVYLKNGSVEFLPDEVMKEWNGAAMILRY